MNSMGQALAKRTGALWMTAVYAFLYLPLGFLIFFSFNSTRQDARFTGFSLRWYEALLRDGRLVDGFWLSLKVAVTTGTLSCILGTFAAFVLVRYHRFKGRTIFSGMINAPLVMPEVIMGRCGSRAGLLGCGLNRQRHGLTSRQHNQACGHHRCPMQGPPCGPKPFHHGALLFRIDRRLARPGHVL